jgi:hypothetical protein
MKVEQVIDLPVDQYVLRADHSPQMLAGFGQTASAAVMPASLSKAEIKQVQEALLKLGYPLQGAADGIAGRTTRKAVELVVPKIHAARKAAALASGRGWKKVAVSSNNTPLLADTNTSPLLAALFENPASAVSGPLNSAYAASANDKKLVKSEWTVSTGGGPITTGGGPITTGGGPVVGSGGVEDPLGVAAGAKDLMGKYESWLKSQAWLPEFLKNPYVASGAVVVVGGLLIFGVTRAMRSSPAAAPAMAGMGEMDALGAMKQAMRPAPKKKRKSRRKTKSRKSKK